MKHDPQDTPAWNPAETHLGLPAPLDCEMLQLLRSFITPILEQGDSWEDITLQLRRKGYGIAFASGHLVILNDRQQPLCTGQMLGAPLREIAARIGRPCIRASCDGQSGELH